MKRFFRNNKMSFPHWNKQIFLLLISFIILLFLIGFPIFNIFKNSFIKNGKINFVAWGNVLLSKSTYKALFNTIKVALGVLIFSSFCGGALSFLAERTDLKYKKLLRFLVFLQFSIPSYILSISWIQITSRGGYLNRIIKLFNSEVFYNFNSYSLFAVIIVLSMHLYPLVFFGISNALRKNKGVLEDAARTLGNSPIKVLKSISLPLVLPSFLSSGLLIFSRTMANFGVPAQLALPVGSEVLTTRIYKAISELNIQELSVLSVLLIVLSYTFYYVTEKWISSRTFYTSSNSTSLSKDLIILKKKSWIVYFLVIIFFIIVLIVPLFTLIISSFMKRWGIDICLKNMTFNNYTQVLFKNDLMRRSFFNSFYMGVISSTFASLIAVIIVYYNKYVKTLSSKCFYSLATLPLSVPNIVLAIGATFSFINPPFKLYGTKWIIILTYTVLFTPIIVRQIKGLSENINTSIDLSAQTLGIPIVKRINRLFFPLIYRGIISGWIISFLIAFREIPISLLLYSTGNETAGVLLFTIQSNAYGLEMTSTVAILIILISIIGNSVVKKIGAKGISNENITIE